MSDSLVVLRDVLLCCGMVLVAWGIITYFEPKPRIRARRFGRTRPAAVGLLGGTTTGGDGDERLSGGDFDPALDITDFGGSGLDPNGSSDYGGGSYDYGGGGGSYDYGSSSGGSDYGSSSGDYGGGGSDYGGGGGGDYGGSSGGSSDSW